MYRYRNLVLQVLLVHPGGPFWAKKETGCWSIPKGECNPDEAPLTTACREFAEETGLRIGAAHCIPLSACKQLSGKTVEIFICEGDCDPERIRSNTFTLEWPPRSGKQQQFPEIDRAAWFDMETARQKIFRGQAGFLDELEALLNKKTAPRIGS